MSTLIYGGVQLTIGYFLMLVVMTYSGPLFLCVVVGLVMGHAAFNARGAMKAAAAKKDYCRTDSDSSPGDSTDESNDESNDAPACRKAARPAARMHCKVTWLASKSILD